MNFINNNLMNTDAIGDIKGDLDIISTEVQSTSFTQVKQDIHTLTKEVQDPTFTQVKQDINTLTKEVQDPTFKQVKQDINTLTKILSNSSLNIPELEKNINKISSGLSTVLEPIENIIKDISTYKKIAIFVIALIIILLVANTYMLFKYI